MAGTVQGSPHTGTSGIELGKVRGYVYPEELDLKPDSDLHKELLAKIMARAQASRSTMSSRYESWRKIDKNLEAYVPLDEDEAAIKTKDSRKPLQVIIPMSFAIRETLVTSVISSLLGEYFFPLEGEGPEDVVGGLLMKKHIQRQMLRGKAELPIHTAISDGFTYGIGAVSPRWHTEYGTVTKTEDTGYKNFFNVFKKTGKASFQERDLIWEGNVLDSIDPYLYFPDPDVGGHEPQEGEFVAWLKRDNRISLLEREANDLEGLINVRYLAGRMGQSSLAGDESGRAESSGISDSRNMPGSMANPVDVLYMYVRLIPREWDLGNEEYPAIYLFGVANDVLIIRAQRMNLDHNKFPIVTCVPDFDGRSIAPVSRLEVIYGMQQTADWYITSRIANVRKSINDMFVADPFRINMRDLLNPGPGKVIRTRRPSWGEGVEGAVKQLAVQDVTKGHLQDVAFMSEMMQRTSGATDAMQGVFDDAPERRTAAEFQGTRQGAAARVGKTARMIYSMFFRDLALMMASHTKQFMTKTTHIKLMNETERRLLAEYNIRVD